ncbi:hypothetical protein [Ferrimonas pelagia]
MENYENLSKMTLDELKGKYDALSGNTVPGLSFYREEIARRESSEQSTEMHRMTKSMKNMTAAILVMTVVNVFAVIVQFWH